MVLRRLIKKGRSDLDPWSARFFNFKSIELVRMATSAARITRVTRQKVEYIDEASEQFVGLEECARIWICLERSGLFLPSDETDWARLLPMPRLNSPSWSVRRRYCGLARCPRFASVVSVFESSENPIRVQEWRQLPNRTT